ncbi:uncharacterized protein LOC131956217 [Physella acuta]|uniref:uncharacterized protein LOC131956217 n=1 Tax=Physella acuta TaxID=109671 RepID=UPI0027DB0C3F|nr:uncharacterized protein LOC131956217 [Physella acuta]
MANTLCMIVPLAFLACFVTAESVSSTTKTITSEEHIKQLVETIGASCRGNCSSDIDSLKKFTVKSAICVSFYAFKTCFDDKCYDAPSDVRTNIHLAKEICDGCSTVKISGMILVLMLFLNLLFKLA